MEQQIIEMPQFCHYTGKEEDPLYPDVMVRGVAQVIPGRGVTPLPIPGYRAVVDANNGRTFAITKTGYKPVPHQELLEHMDELCSEFPEWGTPEKSIKLDNWGGRMKVKYIFKDIDFVIGKTSDGKPDTVHPTIEAFTSYDTSLALRILVGGFRMICSNGMVVGKVLAEYKKKHTMGLDMKKAKKIIGTGMDDYSKAVGLWKSYAERTAIEKEVFAYGELPFQAAEKDLIESEIRKLGSSVSWNYEKPKESKVVINAWDMYNILTDVATHNVKDLGRQTKLLDGVAKTFETTVK